MTPTPDGITALLERMRRKRYVGACGWVIQNWADELEAFLSSLPSERRQTTVTRRVRPDFYAEDDDDKNDDQSRSGSTDPMPPEEDLQAALDHERALRRDAEDRIENYIRCIGAVSEDNRELRRLLQHDLPKDAAKVLRENLWNLYDEKKETE